MGILLSALLAAALKYATAVAAAGLSQRVLIRLRSDVYDKLQRLSFDFYDANPGSSLINRAASDVQAVRVFVDGVIVKILVVLLTLVVYLAYMFSVHVAAHAGVPGLVAAAVVRFAAVRAPVSSRSTGAPANWLTIWC